MCPNCKSKKSKVTHTRQLGNFIQRERICNDCGKSFTTQEWVTNTYTSTKIRVIKGK